MDLVLRSDRVLLGDEIRPAAVAVAAGVIVEVGDRDAHYDAAASTDVDGVLLPGFVDTHVHVDDPGTDWEGFGTATAAAAAAGITTLVDMPLDSVPVTTSVAALHEKRSAAEGNCLVDVHFWGGAVPENTHELGPLAEAGVLGFKCFLTESGNPRFGHLAPEQFGRVMARIAELDSVLLVHAESHDVIAASPAPSGRRYASFLDSRPAAAETEAVALVIETARATGARAHVVHVSSAAVLDLLAQARRSGVAVTAETCPHYLTFAAEEVPDGGTEFAVCPPIRRSHDREALWDALADGTIDAVVSDHSPCAPVAKGHGDFGTVFGGIGSLQLGPRAVWSHAAKRGFGLAELSRWMSRRPAEIAGLADRGAIAVGMRADLCAFDPDASQQVHAADLRHRHPPTPYDGMTLRGAVTRTWVAGRTVYEPVAA
ncbi:allantoinase AllB [Mycolicibacterium grossiae]|uniref:allantoinase n=1 Tax=Mycolicibacterium grossiae TaxID=1552759 RepID=A0A1E8Q881_9MYCO|nr:allantoinase AllB [Mycolicibacterium grossiae]OFJ54646.1 allantoinase [Mycolicibacterium grossiae]QEM45973.1 allantoinase AllB [Mycolicibacterium grossiae]